MQELIERLNRRYAMSMFVTSAMMYDTMNDERKEAADEIESQAAEVASLQKTLDAVAKVASDAEKLVISQRGKIEKYKALCDQMWKVLEMMRGFYPEHCDSALEAWRTMK